MLEPQEKVFDHPKIKTNPDQQKPPRLEPVLFDAALEASEEMSSHELLPTTDQLQAIDQFILFLENNNTAKKTYLDTLITKQKKHVPEHVNPDQADAHFAHVSEVIQLAEQLFPQKTLLAILAAVHDSDKLDLPALGMHEITSSVKARQYLVRSLESVNLPPTFIQDNLVQGLQNIALIIRFHGLGEFPMRRALENSNGAFNENDMAANDVFRPESSNSILPFPLKTARALLDENRSWTKDELREVFYPQYQQQDITVEEIDQLLITALELNICDILVGTSVQSLIKYALHWDQASVQNKDLIAYLNECIFNGFKDNLQSTGLRLLIDFANEDAKTKYQRIWDEASKMIGAKDQFISKISTTTSDPIITKLEEKYLEWKNAPEETVKNKKSELIETLKAVLKQEFAGNFPFAIRST